MLLLKSVHAEASQLQGGSWKDSDKYRFLLSKINLPSHGRDNNEPFKCLPSATCTAPQRAWDGGLGPAPVFIPHTRKMSHETDDTM